MRVLRISHSAVVDAWRERERQLRALGLDVELLSARRWNEAGTDIVLKPRPGEPILSSWTIGSHPALFAYDPVALWRALGGRWDVLDIHEEPFALATAEVLALRWVRSCLSSRTAPPYILYTAQNIAKRYPWPFRNLERWALRGAAGVAACNRDAARIVRDKGARGLVEVIPLGVEVPEAGEVPDRASVTTGAVHVGYAGRLASHKGVEVLLDAVLGDERLRLTLAGDGPAAQALRSEAEAGSERVRFLGVLEGADLEAFYRSLDVLAVPSLETSGWVEQFGRVAVEAMAHGVPVVASDSGALPDVVGGAGILVPPGDADALRDALLRVGTDRILAADLRSRGRARAEECSWPQVARRYHGLYRAITDDPGGQRGEPDEAPGVVRDLAGLPEVVLVAYGSPHLVRAALDPLRGAMPITVVDNSSMSAIREVTEDVGGRYLDPGRNRGFAAGVNHAFAHRQAPGRDVLLLNPDAQVSVDDIAALHAGLHARPRRASVGASQVDGDGTPARVVWPYPSPAATWIEAIGLGAARRTRPDRSFVIGSVLLLNADAIDEVGPFDERFFLYAEETDWALRANRLGWHHAVVDNVEARHLGGATSTDPIRREVHFHASQERFLRKHHGALGWQVARAGSVVGAGVRSVVRRGSARAEARRRLDLYLRGPVRAEAALDDTTAGRAAGRTP